MAKKVTRSTSGTLSYPRVIRIGRVDVTIYRRRLPSGKYGFQVANYASGKRRLNSYPTEAEALEAAQRLTRQLGARQVAAASISDSDAAVFTAAKEELAPFKVELLPAVSTLAECLRLLHSDGGAACLPLLLESTQFYAARRRTVTRKRVSDVVTELLKVSENKLAADSLADLRCRGGRLARDFAKDACDVTTAEIQHWLDNLGLSTQSQQNYRRAIHRFFEFAVARGYAADNPAKRVERIKVRNRETEVFTPREILALLNAASLEFRPLLAIGAFAGLRAKERKRLQWENINLHERRIFLGKHQAKTASRRSVPICDALAEWLAPYAGQSGPVWRLSEIALSKTQQKTAETAGVKWKHNALRHSYASYRFAQVGDAGRVAAECGHRADVFYKYYHELVRPADAESWFAVKPEGGAANVVPMRSAQ